MKEIKFRYRIKNKISGYTGFIHLTLKELEEGRILGVCTPDYDKIEILSRDEYTGLKAKNGEIYEGDIISAYPNWNKIEMNKIIIFQNGCFGFKDIDETFIPFCDSIKRQRKANKYYEIIGNIYENSYLLGKNNA